MQHVRRIPFHTSSAVFMGKPHSHSFSLCSDPVLEFVGVVVGFEGKGGAEGVLVGIPHRHGDTAGWRQADVKELFTCD